MTGSTHEAGDVLCPASHARKLMPISRPRELSALKSFVHKCTLIISAIILAQCCETNLARDADAHLPGLGKGRLHIIGTIEYLSAKGEQIV